MRALLQLPDWSLPERLHLWSNYRKVAARLNAEAAAREAASDLPALDDPVAAVRHERERALTRAEVSAALLQMAQAADADRVAVELERVKRSPTEEPGWDALAAALRQAWKQHDLDRARLGKN
jgi:adenylosuccinate lyase